MPTKTSGCTRHERRAALRALQQTVLQAAPKQIASLEHAIQPGQPLAGYRLSHGYAVLTGAGAVAVDKVSNAFPQPQLLLYAPSPRSSANDWRDFDGPDGPYTLVGFAYVAPYQPGSKPPKRACVAEHEWLVHEAGWHMKDGGMVLTPGATAEPAPPSPSFTKFFWHPAVWDVHFWLGDSGTPTIADDNPAARGGGVDLPQGAFFHVVDGQRYSAPSTPARRER